MPRNLVLVVKAMEGGTVSFRGTALYQFPCCLTPGAASCKGESSHPHSQGPGPSYNCVPKNMPERCPLLAAAILRTAWGDAPTRVHGCPLVATRGLERQESQAAALWEGRPNS